MLDTLELLTNSAPVVTNSRYAQAVQARLATQGRNEAVQALQTAVHQMVERAWQAHDYVPILAVAKKTPDDVLHEDPKLLMWLNGATTCLEQAGG